MRLKTLLTLILTFALAAPPPLPAQTAGDAAANAAKAHELIDAMVKALGGDAWLNQKNRMLAGHVAGFYQGQPNLGTEDVWEFHQWPDKDRTDVTKHRDVLEFLVGREGWEVTYRGKKAIEKEQVEESLRRRDHSIELAVKVWLKDPNTILVYEGKKMAERHLAEQVTLISAQNEAITIQLDADTHLPLNRSFEWRDPVYKDKNTDTEEYDDYHTIDGLPTPFSITRLKNGDMTRQFYITKAAYNQDLGADFWDVDAAAARIRK